MRVTRDIVRSHMLACLLHENAQTKAEKESSHGPILIHKVTRATFLLYQSCSSLCSPKTHLFCFNLTSLNRENDFRVFHMHFPSLKINMVALSYLFNGLQLLVKTCRSKQKDMGRGGRALRLLFGVTVLVGIVWLLFVGIIANHATAFTKKSIMIPSTRDFKHWNFHVGQARHDSHEDFHLNYVSKRRVPSGPDPIHNRYILQPKIITCMCIFSS